MMKFHVRSRTAIFNTNYFKVMIGKNSDRTGNTLVCDYSGNYNRIYSHIPHKLRIICPEAYAVCSLVNDDIVFFRRYLIHHCSAIRVNWD